MIIEPEVPRRIFPGLRVPERDLLMLHERIVPLPLVTLFGLKERVQVGGVTGGTTTGGITTSAVVVIDPVQELVPLEFMTKRTYGVVALGGGVIMRDPDNPRMIFPGLSVPVSDPVMDQVRIAPLPLLILFGLIHNEQDGGFITGGMITTGGIMRSCNIQRILSRPHVCTLLKREFFISSQFIMASRTSCVVALDL